MKIMIKDIEFEGTPYEIAQFLVKYQEIQNGNSTPETTIKLDYKGDWV